MSKNGNHDLPLHALSSTVDDEHFGLIFDVIGGKGVMHLQVTRGKTVERVTCSPEHLAHFRNMRQKVLMPAYRAGALRAQWVLDSWWSGFSG